CGEMSEEACAEHLLESEREFVREQRLEAQQKAIVPSPRPNSVRDTSSRAAGSRSRCRCASSPCRWPKRGSGLSPPGPVILRAPTRALAKWLGRAYTTRDAVTTSRLDSVDDGGGAHRSRHPPRAARGGDPRGRVSRAA